MLDWIIIGILIILALIFAKMRHIKHKFFAIGVIILIIFFYVSMSNVLKNQKVDLKTFNGIIMAGKLYFSWLGHAAVNVKNVAGNAVKMDWAGNSTAEK